MADEGAELPQRLQPRTTQLREMGCECGRAGCDYFCDRHRTQWSNSDL
jgi:hypothetical protein